MPIFVIEEEQNTGYKRIHAEGCKDCFDPEIVGEFETPSELYDALVEGGYGYDDYHASELDNLMMACAFNAFRTGKQSEEYEMEENQPWDDIPVVIYDEPETDAVVATVSPYVRHGSHIGTRVEFSNEKEFLYEFVYLTTDETEAESQAREELAKK